MTRLVIRLLIVPIGIGFAAIAAVIVGLVGAIVWGYGSSMASIAAATGISIIMAASTGADPNEVAAFVMLLWLVAAGMVVVPIALVAVIGEMFGLGSFIVYAFGTGAAFAAVPVLFPGDPATHGWPAIAPLGFLATGIVAGSVYWLIAGRGAARPGSRRGAASAGVDHS